MNLIDRAKELGDKVLEKEKVADKLIEAIEPLEKMISDAYIPKMQNRNSIKVVIDGVEITITKDNCNVSVSELFEDIVYHRQVEKVTHYLQGKYGTGGVLSRDEAEHELQGLRLPSADKDIFTYESVAEIVAMDVVSVK